MAFVQARAGAAFSRDIEEYPEGIIIPVDKPYRWTSADVVRKIKWAACRHFGRRGLKVGHAGTLDPLATGVLLVCVGKATRLADTLQRHDKEYIAEMIFGATTPSYDREKDIDCMYPTDGVSENSLRRALEGFIGEQEQVAPLFSAKSVDGVRAYEMARRAYKAALRDGGKFDHSEVELLSRQRIRISRLELLAFSSGNADSSASGFKTAADAAPDMAAKALPDSPANAVSNETTPPCHSEPERNTCCHSERSEESADRHSALRPNPRIKVIDTSALDLPRATILVQCSKGTYIRALARDIGESLGSGAFLNSLRRTRTGDFSIKDCLSVQQAIDLFAASPSATARHPADPDIFRRTV